MKNAYLFAATTALLFILDDTLRASWVFAIAFFFGSVITTLFKEGERAVAQQEKNKESQKLVNKLYDELH